MKTLLKTLIGTFKHLSKRNRILYLWFAIIGVIAFPLIGWEYTYVNPQDYVGYTLRTIGMILCFTLCLGYIFPKMPYQATLLYITIIFALPFFHTVVLLKNPGSITYTNHVFMPITFMILLNDWKNMIVMYILGISLGIIYCIIFPTDFTVPAVFDHSKWSILILLVGGTLAKLHSEKQIVKEKIEIAKSLGGSIAHEMRNPLGVFKRIFHTVESDLPENNLTLTQEQYNEILYMIKIGDQSIRRTNKNIDMTLKNIKGESIDSSKFVFISMKQIIEDIIAGYGYQTGEREKVSIEIKDDFVFRGDPDLFSFTICNLLKNALHYISTYPKSRISITVNNGTDFNYVYFKDTGPGISVKFIDKLFDDFSTVGKSGGTGLGLPYCKRTLESFSSDIKCHSIEGEFTEFIMSFPICSEIEIDKVVDLDNHVDEHTGANILVVDDSKIDAYTTKAYLEYFKFDVKVAIGYQQAIREMKKTTFDLIFMDLSMPKVDGIQAIKNIRSGQDLKRWESPNHSIIPIVVYSSEDPKDYKKKLDDLGVIDFVAKPAKKNELLDSVNQALSLPDEEQIKLNLKDLKILLVDDSEINRILISQLLKKNEICVEEASGGEQAIKLLQKDHYDLILLDIQMPVLNGLETTEKIRGFNEEVVIIALSGNQDVKSVRDALSVGMNDYITKPVDSNTLILKIHQWISKKNMNEVSISTINSLSKNNDDHHPIIDKIKIDELKGCFISADKIELVVSIFRNESKASLTQLKEYYENKDIKAFKAVAHKLKGSSGNIGAALLYSQLKEIEQKAKNMKFPDDGWDIQLDETFKITQKILEQEFHIDTKEEVCV